MLISDDVKELLRLQWGAEVANSHFYLSSSSFLYSIGMMNASKMFLGHYKDEISHSEKIFNFLVDMGEGFSPPAIPSIDVVFSGLIDVAKRYLEKEIETTESLDAIKKITIDEACPVAESFVQGMIDYQINEYAEVMEFLKMSELAGNDNSAMMAMDSILSEKGG